MAWEERRRRRYYYRSTRVDGRVVRQYLGTGAEATAAAEAIEQARGQRRVEQARLRAMEAEDAPLDQLLDAMHNGVDLLMEATLLGRGFREHHGEWRRA